MKMDVEHMENKRIARWGKVAPYGESFIESRLPGFNKNLYKIINKGVFTSVPTLIEQIQLVSGVGLKLISDDTVK